MHVWIFDDLKSVVVHKPGEQRIDVRQEGEEKQNGKQDRVAASFRGALFADGCYSGHEIMLPEQANDNHRRESRACQKSQPRRKLYPGSVSGVDCREYAASRELKGVENETSHPIADSFLGVCSRFVRPRSSGLDAAVSAVSHHRK